MKPSIFILLFLSLNLQAQEADKPKWDYGIGFGAVRFEQYPAAGQYTQLALPIPTFEYRGKILYADDRDGAQLFLFRSDQFKVEISGFGFPPLDSSENSNRIGMKDLPLLVALGPQVLYRPHPWVEIIFGYFESLSLTSENQKASGFAYQARVVLSHEFQSELFKDTTLFHRLFLTSRYGSRKMQSIYYDVNPSEQIIDREVFKSREGLLSQELGYLLQANRGRWNYYLGGAWADYSQARNKKSPLFQSERAFTFFIGTNYILKESKY